MVSTYLVVGEKLQMPLVDFLGKWNGLVFCGYWFFGLGKRALNCELTVLSYNEANNFLEFDFNFFYQTIIFI